MSSGNAPSGPGKRMGATALSLCMSATTLRTSTSMSSGVPKPFSTRFRLLKVAALATD